MMMETRKIARTTEEVEDIIKKLMLLFPDDYKTASDVIRAGVMRLYNWRITNHESMRGN